MLFNTAFILALFGMFENDLGCDWILTSVFRDEEHNERVGGVKNSMHLQGLAVDAVPLCSLESQTVYKVGYKWFDRIYEYDDGHWHFDIKGE